tara:strand:+ start:404 stop:1036 length:633 start_codon:yes stop_codon:yes gene_type:complete
MLYNIVISSYKENLDWINYMKKEYIIHYNKSNNDIKNAIKLKNIGNEGETFLHHIIENYNNLPEYLIIVQGNPFDHMNNVNYKNFQNKIDKLVKSNIDNITPLFTNNLREKHYRFKSLKTPEYYSYLFKGPVPMDMIFAAGCQYIIPKNNIINRPIEFYKKVHKMLINNTITEVNMACDGKYEFNYNEINGWCLERLFPYIFNIDININI